MKKLFPIAIAGLSAWLLAFLAACAPAAQATPTSATGQPTATPAATPAKATPTEKPAASVPRRGGTIRVSSASEATSLDPHRSWSGWDRFTMMGLYDALTTYDEKGEIVPALAESWSLPDPTTIVLRIRKGVKFHDGTNVDAEAVYYNLQTRLADPNVNPGTLATTRQWLKSAEKGDEYTVKINLITPYAGAFNALTGGIAQISSPAAVKAYSADTKEYGRHPVGAGPFKFTEWVADDHITISRFEGYWRTDKSGGKLPYLDGAVIRPFTDPTVKLAALKAGSLDMIDSVLFQDAVALKDSKDPVLEQSGLIAGFMLRFNLKNPPFNNKALRQAIAWVVDREAIDASVFSRIGAPGFSPVPSGSWAHIPELKPYTPPNVETARALLARGGKPEGFEFEARTYREDEAQYLQVLQQNLVPLNVKLKIVRGDIAAVYAPVREGKYWEAYAQSIVPNVDPEGYLWYWHHSTGTGAVWSGYNNPEVDQLLQEARSKYDQGERKAIYKRVQEIVLEESSNVIIHFDPRFVARRSWVKNYTRWPDGYMNYNDVWLEK